MTAVDRRLAKAWDFARASYRSPGFRKACYRGSLAAMKGQPVEACPYPHDPLKSWRAVYRAAWITGWRHVRG